jgi:hypothetical protein
MKKINLLLVLVVLGHRMLLAQCDNITSIFSTGTEGEGSNVTGFLEEDNGNITVLWEDKRQLGTSYNSKTILTKLDPAGTLIWQREFDQPGMDSPGNLLKAPDGGYVFGMARTAGPNFSDSYLFKTDADGIEEWNILLETESFGQNSGRGTLLDDQGNILFYGLAQGLAGCSGYVFRVSQISLDGNVNWTNCYNESQWRAVHPIYLESTSEYLFGVTINEGMRVIKLDLNGEITYDEDVLPAALEGTGEDLRGKFIKGLGDDYLLISGNPSDCFSSTVIKFNAQNEVEWELQSPCTEPFANNAEILEDGTWLMQMWDGLGSYFQRLTATGEVLSTSTSVEGRWISEFNISASNTIVYGGRYGVVENSDAILEQFTCADLTESTIIQPTTCEIPEFLPQEGLVAWYPFNGNANDGSGNNLNGVVEGPNLVSDRNGEPNSAYYFNGTGDIINVEHNDLLNFQAGGELSVSYWIQGTPDPLNVDHIISKQTGSGSNQDGWNCALQQNTSEPAFILKNGSGSNQCLLNSSETALADEWYNVVSVYNGSLIRIYMNGVLTSETECVTEIGDNTNSLQIGSCTWATNFPNVVSFTGVIDDIAIYNRALTQAEVEAIYNEELPPVCDPCLANYMQGDFNCDGSVGTDDLLVFLVNFGISIEP